MIEDRTRKLPASERVTHALLAVNGGAFLLALAARSRDGGRIRVRCGRRPRLARSGHRSLPCAGLRPPACATCTRRASLTRWRARPRRRFRRTPAVGARSAAAPASSGRRLIWALLDAGPQRRAHVRDGTRAWLLFDGRVTVFEPLPAGRGRSTSSVNLAGAPVVGPAPGHARAGAPCSRAGWTPPASWSISSRTQRTRPSLHQRLGDRLLRRPGRHARSPSAMQAARNSCRNSAPLGRALRRAPSTSACACTLRLGLVLGWGGALPMLGAPHLAALGARIGSGRQWVSWVHVDDVVAAIAFLIRNPAGARTVQRGLARLAAPGTNSPAPLPGATGGRCGSPCPAGCSRACSARWPASYPRAVRRAPPALSRPASGFIHADFDSGPARHKRRRHEQLPSGTYCMYARSHGTPFRSAAVGHALGARRIRSGGY